MTNKISDALQAVIKNFEAGEPPSMLQLAAMSDDDIARWSILQNLLITYSPMSQEVRQKSTAQLLQYTKARPMTRVETNVVSAETWAHIAGDDDD